MIPEIMYLCQAPNRQELEMRRSVVTPCKVPCYDLLYATAFASCLYWGERIYHNIGHGTKPGHRLQLRDFFLPPSCSVSFSYSPSQSIKTLASCNRRSREEELSQMPFDQLSVRFRKRTCAHDGSESARSCSAATCICAKSNCT